MVRVELTNRHAYIVTKYPSRISAHFQYTVPNPWFIPAVRDGKWDGTVSMLYKLRKTKDRPSIPYVSSGLFLLKQDAFKHILRDRRVYPDFLTTPRPITGFKPHKFQVECVDTMREKSNCGGLILNATASGKTTIAGLYFAALKGAAVFVVDERTLMYQTQTELSRILGEPVGIVGDSKFAPERITVAMVHTLHLHRNNKAFKPWVSTLEAMIIDEVHMALNNRSIKTVKAIKPKAVFGLTATLQLQVEKVLFNAVALCGPVCYTYSYARGMKEGVLAPGVVLGVDLVRNSPPARVVNGTKLYLQDVVRNRLRNRVTCDYAREWIARGGKVIILAERLGHLKRLSKRLADIPHKVVRGAMPTRERIIAKNEFELGETKLLIANRVFKKGINIKSVTMIIDAAGLPDPNDAQQKFGRGARTFPGKRGFIYVDIGERTPAKKKRPMNRYEGVTNARRDTLAGLGVPVVRVPARKGVPVGLERAERTLEKLIASLK